MDRRERLGKLEDSLLGALDGFQSTLWTALPGYVTAINYSAMTVSVQPTIQGIILDQDGNEVNVSLPLCVDVPIQYPAGGGFILTFPIAINDECLLTFSARCIDSWWQSGGIQTQAEQRMHDLSDGFANIGVKSQPNVVSNISATTVQLRSLDGLAYVEIAGGHIANIVAPGGINLNGVTIDHLGNLSSPATITATTDVVGGGKHLKTHVHSGVTVGAGNTGAPV